ncbi:hypothetical protein PVAP13_6NG223300 [Panicum virgatum]|uniref:Uncharacterized protein n=1 Tax=Panicum virgatum TaxID=38727 RepID=A0A8T0QYK7_PANVG|nr:hypothetical protein PVAP13_6NG223300 [Panicum virgatum]
MGFYDSDMTVDMVWSLYRICGGRQEAVPNDRESCNHVPARSPPPPPPPPPRQLPPPPPPSRPARQEGLDGWRLALFIASVVVGGSIVVWLSLWLASWLVSLSRTPAAAEVGSTVIPAAGSIGLPVGQQDQVQEAVRASGAGGGLPPIGVQDSPPPAPLRFSPGHIRALVKDLLEHFKWAPPRRNDPASTGPPPTPPLVIQGS